MKNVKEGGQIITVDGVQYRIGSVSAEAINIWLEVLEEEPDAEQMIELYRTESSFADTTRGYRGDMVPISKIKAALEK